VAGGIVLAGGRSSRMGRSKATLEWHGSTLLRRVAGLVGRSVSGPVVIVRSAGQPLPALPSWCEVVEDDHDGRGPLEGIAAGLRAVGERAAVAYVSSTDVPMLHTSFVGAVVGGIGERDEICVPAVGRGWQPLAAAYRTSLVGVLEELLAADERRVSAVFGRCRVRRLDRATLLGDRAVAAGDPELESVVNLNDPAAYAAARARPAPAIGVRVEGRLGRAVGVRVDDGLGRSGGATPGSVRAATLGGLASAVGVGLGEGVAIELNGSVIGPDGDLPLERGDAVVFTVGAPG
jgi:molybdenum cofactor guanylyltransferase